MEFPDHTNKHAVAAYMLREYTVPQLQFFVRKMREEAGAAETFAVQHALECEARGADYALCLVLSCLDLHAPVPAAEVRDAR